MSRPPLATTCITSPLLDYLRTSPLPTVVLSLSPDSTTTVLSNFALAQLTRGETLLGCLSPTATAALESWVRDPAHHRELSASPSPATPNSRTPSSTPSIDPCTPDDDLELDLHLCGADGVTRVMAVFWRIALTNDSGRDLVILTALAFPPRRLSRMSGSPLLDAIPRNVVTPKREERSVEERLTELELLTDCSAVGLARLDLEGRVIWVNASWLDITEHEDGVPLAEWSRCLDADSYQKLLTDFKLCRQELVPLVGRFRLKCGKHVLAHCTPNNSEPSLVTGWISNLTDVTTQVLAEEAITLLALERERVAKQQYEIDNIEARRRDAEEQRKQQELLIDVTSHEIRNPISGILQNSDLTRTSLLRLRATLQSLQGDGILPNDFVKNALLELDDDIEAIESIWECALAQERIANDILGLAQIGANRYSVTPVSFCLVASLRATLRMFTTECRTKDIALELTIGPALAALRTQAEIMADPVRLSQIITNLVSNAVRFTATTQVRKITLSAEVSSFAPPEGTPLVPPKLSCASTPPTGGPLYVYFAVTDTGPGMSLEECQRIFERFMQATPLTHVTMGGSGLGLWIARNLCELHGGRIEVVSTPHVGSCFRGFISAASSPLASPSPSPRPRRIARPPSHAVTFRDSGAGPLKILIVDDNQINRTILVRQLGQTGRYQVDCAKDGQEALEMMLAKGGGGYDCCLMDVEMPVLDGISATKQLRVREASTGRRLRVVGCTGNARDGQLQAALASGMDAIVTKPYRLAQLMEQLVAS